MKGINPCIIEQVEWIEPKSYEYHNFITIVAFLLMSMEENQRNSEADTKYHTCHPPELLQLAEIFTRIHDGEGIYPIKNQTVWRDLS
jgi:hypothetical protein